MKRKSGDPELTGATDEALLLGNVFMIRAANGQWVMGTVKKQGAIQWWLKLKQKGKENAKENENSVLSDLKALNSKAQEVLNFGVSTHPSPMLTERSNL